MFNLNPAAMKPQSEFGREREGGRFTFIAITTGVYIVTILVVSSLVARATRPYVMISSLGNEGMLPWSHVKASAREPRPFHAPGSCLVSGGKGNLPVNAIAK